MSDIFSTHLPVHCCCNPAKRLGWVPVDHRRVGPVTFVIEPAHAVIFGSVLRGTAGHDTIPAKLLDTEIAHLDVPGCRPRLAVKSADVPIETWRKVPGFIEEPTVSGWDFGAGDDFTVRR